MRAAVFRGTGRLETEEWPRPSIGPGELLLRLRGCGLCGSDIAKMLAPTSAAPAVFGHEIVGDVVEIGAGVADFAPGDRVVAAHHVPCGDCHYCRRGSHSMCPAFKTSHLDPGGFAEYVRVPAPNVRHATFKIPPPVSDEAASFIEPVGCCLRAVRRADVAAGDTAVVVGLGSIGHLFVPLLQRAGATVVGVDDAVHRIDFAERLGLEALRPPAARGRIATLSEGRGADHVIVTGGAASVLAWAVGVVRDGGSIHYFAGGHGHALPIALDTLYQRELTITATYSSSPADLAESSRLITGGEIAVARLYTHRVSIERLGEGVDLMRRRDAVKVYVTP